MERTEDYAELRESLKSAQERQWELEQQHEERGSHLRTAKQRAADSEGKVIAAEAETAGLRRELASAKRLAERVPKLEQDLREEQDRCKAASAGWAAAETELDVLRDEATELLAEAANLRSALADAQAELSASAEAIASAKALRSAIAGIVPA